MQVYLFNTYSNLLIPRQYVMNLFNFENGLYRVEINVFLTRFGHKLLLSLSAQPDHM